MRPEEITIAHLVKEAGYATGHFGKWHVGPVKASSPTSPGAMGFDQWLSHDNFFELNPSLSRNGGPPQEFQGESSEIIIDDTIRFIGEAKGKPFFTIVWFGSPHEPYSGLPDDLALYDDLPQEYAKKTVSLTSNETGRRTKRPLRDVLRERYAEITAMDRAIGKLRDYLKSAGMRENTLLWYCGDNGTPPSGYASSPLRGLKGKMYDGGVRVPGLIEWPARIKNGRRSAVNTVTSDMLPTICALAGQELPDRQLDGINIVPLLNGKMKKRAAPICFWSYNTRNLKASELTPYIDPELQKGTTPLVKLMGDIATRNFRNYHHPVIDEKSYTGPRTILTDRYKLVIDAEKNSGTELFDMRADGAESKSLATAKPGVREDLKKQLRQWQTSVLGSLRGGDYK